jgi:hypothetical protein
MALRMGHLFDALRQAQGVSEDDARRAAEEVANYDNRIARVESDLTVVKFMIGTNIALTLVILSIVLRLAARN